VKGSRKRHLSKQSIPPRIAASSYLNTAPLIWSFLHGSKRESAKLLTDAAPARCAEMLARAEVEVALVPVIEYHRLPGIALVPDVCVGSHCAVRSVVIASKHAELKSLRRIALDNSSRTSSVLVKIIFREFLGVEPQWQASPADLTAMLRDNDAALIIGDPAMKIPRDEFHIFDLATLWREHTGLGFVFAMWMARDKETKRVRTLDLAAARDEGLAHVEEIVSAYEPRLGLTREALESYLTQSISFSLDEELRAGLALFFELAQRHKLISERRDLKMLY
jgi:chorismate dehydratase